MRVALVLTIATSFLLKADCIDGVQTYQRLVAALSGW